MRHGPDILVVDTDEGVTSLLCTYLARFGFMVHTAADGAAMWEQLGSRSIDLVVLNLTLCDAQGMPLAQALRAESPIALIVLVSCSNPVDRVRGLEMGADDCLSKPLEPRELVARIHTVLRRAGTRPPVEVDVPSSDPICFDGWALQPSDRRLTSPSGEVVPLSNAEYLLLTAFLNAPRRVLSRDQLMEQARGRAMDSFERSIDLLVSRLRQKLLHESSAGALIRTVRGAGYVFDAQPVQGQAGIGH